MGYFRIKNWSEFQHYRDRCPPWIKLHRSTLTSRTWVKASDSERVLAVACMLIAADTDNRIPADPEYVRRVAYLHADPDFAPLLKSQFIEYIAEGDEVLADASASIANDTKRSSEERRGETEESQRRVRATPSSPDAKTQGEADPPPGLDPAAWSRWRDYRAQIRKPIKPVSIPAAQRELAGFGADQAAVVEQSIANSYQGLFVLKNRPKVGRPPEPRRELPDAFDVARRASGDG